jgi:hypothetical protein
MSTLGARLEKAKKVLKEIEAEVRFSACPTTGVYYPAAAVNCPTAASQLPNSSKPMPNYLAE